MPLSYNTNNLLWDRKVDFCTLLTPEATKSWTFCRAVSYVYILYRLAVSYILSIPTEALLFILWEEEWNYTFLLLSYKSLQ